MFSNQVIQEKESERDFIMFFEERKKGKRVAFHSTSPLIALAPRKEVFNMLSMSGIYGTHSVANLLIIQAVKIECNIF